MALPVSVKDREYDKFVDDGSGNTAIRAVVIGGGGSSPLTTKGDVYVYGTADARLPVGTNGQVLQADSTQTLGVKWGTSAGGGDVVGPASATDNALARFDTTTGKLIQNGQTIEDDNGVVTANAMLLAKPWTGHQEVDEFDTSAIIGWSSTVNGTGNTINQQQVGPQNANSLHPGAMRIQTVITGNASFLSLIHISEPTRHSV
jgi:hypothetical protein